METYRSHSTDIGEYASEQLARAERLLTVHVPDGATGCCRACGRPTPCDAATQATRQREQYGRCADAHRAALVRPYVIHEVRGGKV